ADSRFLDAFRDLANLRRIEALLQLLEHRITRALCRDPERAKTCASHRCEQLGRRSSRSEIRRVEVDTKIATGNFLAHFDRVTRGRIESRIHKIELAHTGIA